MVVDSHKDRPRARREGRRDRRSTTPKCDRASRRSWKLTGGKGADQRLRMQSATSAATMHQRTKCRTQTMNNLVQTVKADRPHWRRLGVFVPEEQETRRTSSEKRGPDSVRFRRPLLRRARAWAPARPTSKTIQPASLSRLIERDKVKTIVDRLARAAARAGAPRRTQDFDQKEKDGWTKVVGPQADGARRRADFGSAAQRPVEEVDGPLPGLAGRGGVEAWRGVVVEAVLRSRIAMRLVALAGRLQRRFVAPARCGSRCRRCRRN